MTIRPSAPPAVRWITQTLEDAGHETWAVGGAVRDACLGRRSGDWDFATRARPGEVRRLFRRTVPIGIDHGTVGVLARDGMLYEVTTFRRDVETDGRHAVVAFADTLEEDLARRDFTINAIAWHPIRDEVCDPFDGVGDIDRRVLRTVGDPDERFREDYLRILRALRFAGYFPLEIEERTWASLRRLIEHLPALSAERIREELLKVLHADPDPSRALDLYAQSGALRVLYPELDELRTRPASDPPTDPRAFDGGALATGRGTVAAVDEWTLAVAAAACLPRGRPLLRLACLLRGCEAGGAAALLLRLRLSNHQVEEVARLAAAEPVPAPGDDDATFRRWLGAIGIERLSAVVRIELARARAAARLGLGDRAEDVVAAWRRGRAVRAAAPPLTIGALALDGRGLIALGLKPGPDFGRILQELLAWVIEDPARNDADRLRERVRAIVGGAGDV